MTPLRRLFLFSALSVAFHSGAILSAALRSSQFARPLTGGGEVTVSIVAADGQQAPPNRYFGEKLSQPSPSTASGDGDGENAGGSEPAGGELTAGSPQSTGSEELAGSRPAGRGAGRTAGSQQGVGSNRMSGSDAILTEIRQRIEGAKRYPELARRAGLEGIAEVTFRIKEDGAADEVKLARGTGREILDSEAVATVSRAAPYPPYPEELTVAIRFSLDRQ